MARFKKRKKYGVPALSTASLPDVIFMLLFFFMVTTVMREVTLIVKVKPPEASEVQRLEKKSLVSYIYIGEPIKSNLFGTKPRIQLNDQFGRVEDIPAFITSERQKRDEYFEGINEFFRYVEQQTRKIQYRIILSRYRGKRICPECRGSRLRKDASYVKINGRSISDLVMIPLEDLLSFVRQLELSKYEKEVVHRVMIEIENRLVFLCDVGLGYLTLNRLSSSLSGGESQRINLAISLGSSLVGSMYILDEPSIGLHPRDTHRLIRVLKKLKEYERYAKQ